jgi:hypothetical protein
VAGHCFSWVKGRPRQGNGAHVYSLSGPMIGSNSSTCFYCGTGNIKKACIKFYLCTLYTVPSNSTVHFYKPWGCGVLQKVRKIRKGVNARRCVRIAAWCGGGEENMRHKTGCYNPAACSDQNVGHLKTRSK